MSNSSTGTVATLLKALLDEATTDELTALRAERIDAISKRRRRTLDETFGALDTLLSTFERQRISLQEVASQEPEPELEPERDADEDNRETESYSVTTWITEDDEPTPEPEADEPIADVEQTAVAKPQAVEEQAVEPENVVHSNDVAAGGADYVSDTVSQGWDRGAELLFDDVLRLYRLHDIEGALISLERLLATSPINDDLNEFISLNQEKLLQAYEVIIGSWDQIPGLIDDSDDVLPEYFFNTPKIRAVYSSIDGRLTLREIIDSQDMSHLETIAVVHQLVRAHAISVEAN